jgi:hypothetical protein
MPWFGAGCCSGGTPLNCDVCDAVWPAGYTGEWVVDLGVGGWSDVDCNNCDQISGEYTTDEGQVATCSWQYEEQLCTIPNPPSPDYVATLRVSLFFSVDAVDGSPYWRVYGHVLAYGSPPGSQSWAYYRSAQYNSNDNTDCWDALDGDGKVQLTKYWEAHQQDPGSGIIYCADTMPATIEAWREAA